MNTDEIINRLKITEYITSTNINQAIIDDAGITGENNVSSGEASSTLGTNLEATNTGEVAVGNYNQSNEDTVFSVGTGDDNQGKNSLEVTSNGDVFVEGVGGYDGTNPDSAMSLAETLNNGFLQDNDEVRINCGTSTTVINNI